MNRVKQMAGALMLLVPLAACDEGTPPPPTGSIEGTVSIEGTGADGVTVTLSNGTTATTAGGGAYRFAGVEGGSYTVTISGYPSDASFDATQASAVIATANQVVRLNFTGSYIRTSSILGDVTVEGVGQAGVTVTLSGMSDGTTRTSAEGSYAFTGLRAGTYTVEVSGFDSDAYSFSNTSESATVGVGASAEVDFAGTHIRTASIRGTVTVAGEGLEGVLVSLSGVSEATRTTDGAGSYEFTGLQAGSYTVAISGFDAEQYGFSVTTRNEDLSVGERANLNFEGTALRTASVTGRLFIDEVTNNNEMDEGEAPLEVAGVKVVLVGPLVGDADTTTTDAKGTYGFDSLVMGNYRVRIDQADTTAKLPAYVAYGGPADGYLVSVETGSSAKTQDFPYDITRQTVKVKAMFAADTTAAGMGGPAAGVTIDLHATSGEAQAGDSGALGRKKTDSTGYVTFMFDRDDDKGPGGGLVYARATAPAGTALEGAVTIPIEYEPMNHEAAASSMFMVLSTRAILEFSVVNRSNDGESGGDPMAGWTVHVWNDSASASLKDTATAAPDTTLASAAKTGKVAVTYNGVERDQKYYIRLPGGTPEVSGESQDTSVTKGEEFKLTVMAGAGGKAMTMALDADSKTAATPFLVYEHTGLALPAAKMDLGEVAVTFTTQTLVVGVHHERDDIEGFTNIDPGDTRPSRADDGDADNDIDSDIVISLAVPDSLRGYPVPLKDENGQDIDYDRNPKTNVYADYGRDDGLVRYEGLPSDVNLIVEAEFLNTKIGISPERLNVFGKDVDTEKTATTGAFGGAGGLMPVVQFCPQKFEPGAPESLCSTFAYKFKSGVIDVLAHSKTYTESDSVPAAGIAVKVRRIKGLGATSPKPDTTGASGAAEFLNLVDGTYVVTATPDEAGNWDFDWGPDTVVVLGGTHAEVTNLNTASDPLHVVATYQKTKIQGTVVNDYDADGVADDEETRAGLEVSAQRKSGTRYSTVATTETDAGGEYEFKSLPEGTYRVVGAEADGYRLCSRHATGPDAAGKCSTSGTSPALARSVDVTTTAVAANRTYERDATLPYWDPWAYQVASQGDDTDFVVLFKNSRLTGNAIFIDTNPTPHDTSYAGHEVRAYLCSAWTGANTVGNRCTRFPNNGRPDETTTTDSEGDWEMTGLQEGVYRVSVDVPQGYTSVPATLETSEPADGRPAMRGDGARTRNLNFVVSN